jgi:hypothetical protein
MARYDTYRQVARQEKHYRQSREARQAIEAAYQAVLAAKEAEDAFGLADLGTPAEREAFRARCAAVDALYALDPKHHHFS